MAREPSMKLFVLDTRGLDVWGIVGTLASGKRRNLSPRPQNGQDLGGDGFDVVRLELAPVGHIARVESGEIHYKLATIIVANRA